MHSLVTAWEEEQQAKGLSLGLTQEPEDDSAEAKGRRWSQGGSRGGDAGSTDGDERYKVISFGGEGRREEAFVASIEEAKEIAGQDGIIEDAGSSNGNGHKQNGTAGLQADKVKEAVLVEAAG